VVFGLGDGRLELRFLPANADVQGDDTLITSGLDGVFPSGLPVARVSHLERDSSYTFARIFCLPLAGVENFGEIMVLDAREALTIPEEIMQPPSPPTVRAKVKRRMKKE
jgi:rod shape-determining protein MreC